MDAEHPNVLLICTDHWPGLVTRPAGHREVITPTLAQLADSGIHYSNAYSTCPSCIPARRSLMTGLTARTHGDRIFDEHRTMPAAPTLAQCFRDSGYHAFAVGKLHVYPQRDRIGFDEVILNEEGRHHLGMRGDDWEQYLAENGHMGLEHAGGLCSNDYNVRTWHLPDHCHQTEWSAREMCRAIHRRDPQRPGFWYLSFSAPHPPVWPLQTYLDLYRDIDIAPPVIGQWAQDEAELPYALRSYSDGGLSLRGAPPAEIELARRAFYATLTHIDHQIRVVIGCLREEGLLDNTIIAFTSDHGDMLGDHGRWAKTLMYEMSAKVPLIIVPAVGDGRLEVGSTDDRLTALYDLMPTLLDMAGIDIPANVEGCSLLNSEKRSSLYGEHWEGERATRMVRDERYKLIYYPVGNHLQLFDLADDPREERDLAAGAGHAVVRQRLEAELVKRLYGDDVSWVRDGDLVGEADRETVTPRHRELAGQRGIRFL